MCYFIICYNCTHLVPSVRALGLAIVSRRAVWLRETRLATVLVRS